MAAEQFAGSGFGTLLPLGWHLVSLRFARRRSRLLSGAGSLAGLGGGLAMRRGVKEAGHERPRRPASACASPSRIAPGQPEQGGVRSGPGRLSRCNPKTCANARLKRP